MADQDPGKGRRATPRDPPNGGPEADGGDPLFRVEDMGITDATRAENRSASRPQEPTAAIEAELGRGRSGQEASADRKANGNHSSPAGKDHDFNFNLTADYDRTSSGTRAGGGNNTARSTDAQKRGTAKIGGTLGAARNTGSGQGRHEPVAGASGGGAVGGGGDSGSGDQGDWPGDANRRRGNHALGGHLPVRREEPSPSRPPPGVPMRAPEHLPDAYQRIPYGETAFVDDGIDFRKYLGILIKHRWLIAGVVAVTVGIGLFLTLLQTPVYRASATIQIDRHVANVAGIEDVEPTNVGRDAEFYQTQYELLRSRSLAERVAGQLNLAENDDFISGGGESPLAALRDTLFGSGAASSEPVSLSERQSISAGLILNGLSINPVRASSVVSISFDSTNPELAQRVANAVAETYMTANLDRRYESSSYARTFLQERLAQVKLKLEETEKALVAYAKNQNLVSAGEKETLSRTDLTATNSALTEATRHRISSELLWQQVQNANEKAIAIPQFLENDRIKELRTIRAELAAEYKDKLNLFKPAFPEMVKLQARINEIGAQIKAEVEIIKESVAARYQAALDEEQALKAEVEGLKSAVMDFEERNIQYTILQREVDTNRTLYEGLLQRYKEIGVAGGVGANNISIVDRAETPGVPYKPNFRTNLAKALVLGLFFGCAAAFGREYFDNSFKSPEDVEQTLNVPLLGIIPSSSKDEDEGTRSAHIAEAYQSLRTALQFSTADGVPRSLLVTSARPGEGKSTTAATLARQFAQLGVKVLLIDADLRKPTLHKHFSCDSAIGLSNYLVGRASPMSCFVGVEDNLTLMPCGTPPPNPAELIAGPRTGSLLAGATQRYELVIIDGPPVAGLADAPLLASMTDGTLLVIEAHSTGKTVATAAIKRLLFARGYIVGAVMNKFDYRKSGYVYGYGYGYGYGADDYYGYGAKAEQAITDETRA